jgi:hypothetical protein
MLMGIFGCFGALKGACCTDSTCCRATAGGKLNEVWPQGKNQIMYAISLLKNGVVLSKSEGPQKWLAPCSTDVHSVARTADVCILEKESYRQTQMIM